MRTLKKKLIPLICLASYTFPSRIDFNGSTSISYIIANSFHEMDESGLSEDKVKRVFLNEEQRQKFLTYFKELGCCLPPISYEGRNLYGVELNELDPLSYKEWFCLFKVYGKHYFAMVQPKVTNV